MSNGQYNNNVACGAIFVERAGYGKLKINLQWPNIHSQYLDSKISLQTSMVTNSTFLHFTFPFLSSGLIEYKYSIGHN